MAFLNLQSTSIATKFSVICSIAMLLVLALVWQNWRVDQARQTQLQTIAQTSKSIDALLEGLELLQQHRSIGLVAKHVDNSLTAQWRSIREALGLKMQEAMQAVPPEWSASSEASRQLQSDFLDVINNAESLSTRGAYEKHNQLAGQILGLIRSLSDESGLTQLPVVGAWYLMSNRNFSVPALAERLAWAQADITQLVSDGIVLPSMTADARLTLQAANIELDAIRDGFEKGAKAGSVDMADVDTQLAQTRESIQFMSRVLDDLAQGSMKYKPSTFLQDTLSVITQSHALAGLAGQGLATAVANEQGKVFNGMVLRMAIVSSAVLVMAVLAAVVFRDLAKRISKVLRSTRELAEGRLDRSFEQQSFDEVGQIAKSLEMVRLSERAFVAQLRRTTLVLAQSGNKAGASSATARESAHAQAESASHVAASVEEMAVSVQQIADHAQQAESLANQVEQAAEQGKLGISSVVKSMETIGEASTNLTGSIQQLGNSSESIVGIVKTIQDIASQTNLLALNAAIEAARAGEQGRGFAVVADEVRKLAEKTAHSTTEIAEIVQRIRGDTTDAVGEVSNWAELIDDGLNNSGKASELIVAISQNAEQSKVAVREINRAIAEQSVASSHVSEKMETIASRSEQGERSAKQLDEIVSELNHIGQEITQQLKRYVI